MRDSKNNAEFLASFDVNANNGSGTGTQSQTARRPSRASAATAPQS